MITTEMTVEDQRGDDNLSFDGLVHEMELVGRRLADVRTSIGRVIFGQEDVIDEAIITLLSGGHVLLVGVPGLAKTKLVEILGTVLGLENRRIQCTPDLMPSDILGSEVLEQDEDGRRSFRFIKGPIFTQLLMADEINRASPRTQSALLQAMQEHRVTIAGEDRPLPHPFHVLATQNPLEQEGTYPLPEAQLDRFFMQINVSYPDQHAERKMLLATTGIGEDWADQVLDAQQLVNAQRLIRHVPVGESVVNAILQLVGDARPGVSRRDDIVRHIAWGPGPRASQCLMLGCRARAVLQGRLSPSVEDVLALAAPILRHRMALNFAARADAITVGDVIEQLCEPLR